MSLPIRTRRLANAAGLFNTPITTPSAILPQTRAISWFRRNKDTSAAPTDILREEYLTKKPKAPEVTRGTLASSSIFEDEDVAGPKPEAADGPQGPVARNPRNMAVALDPNPKARIQFEKKMVIKEITKRGRLTKAEVLKRTERELVSRSHLFKTSLKKLRPLATQITGKTVEEAIVQMRFSKKKAAKDVKEHLEHARNEAVVKRGMGLGAVNGEADGFRKVLIVDKDGKRIKVGDPTRMWIEQAWVGKGKGTKTPDYRARGQVFMMDNPRTHIVLKLREEKTRIRLHQEREEKLARRKTWVQLPNRKITSQRQYYSW